MTIQSYEAAEKVTITSLLTYGHHSIPQSWLTFRYFENGTYLWQLQQPSHMTIICMLHTWLPKSAVNREANCHYMMSHVMSYGGLLNDWMGSVIISHLMFHLMAELLVPTVAATGRLPVNSSKQIKKVINTRKLNKFARIILRDYSSAKFQFCYSNYVLSSQCWLFFFLHVFH